MPMGAYFNGGGNEAMANMQKEYGAEKGKHVFYATANKRKMKPMAKGGIVAPRRDQFGKYPSLDQYGNPQDDSNQVPPPPPPQMRAMDQPPVEQGPPVPIQAGPPPPPVRQGPPAPMLNEEPPPVPPQRVSQVQGPPIPPPQAPTPPPKPAPPPPRIQGNATQQYMDEAARVAGEKPKAWQNILGAIAPRIDFHPNITRDRQNLPLYKARADEERSLQAAQSNEALKSEQMNLIAEQKRESLAQQANLKKAPQTLQQKIDEAIAAGYSPEEAKYIGAGWKPPEAKTPPALHNVPPGNVAVGPDGKPVYTNPAVDKPLKDPSRDDRAIEIYQKPPNQRTPDEVAYLKGFQQWVDATKTNPGVMRIEALGQTREMPVLDTKNQNSPMFLSAADINKANTSEPGRYIPAGTAAPALTKTALLEDIRGNVQQVRQSLNTLPDFTGMDRTKIAFALKSRDPKSAISALISSGAAGSLTPQQQDYLINTTNLIENAMAMRSVLGTGAGSEDMRSAIMATIPGPTTPDKRYALQQLDQFEKVLGRLERGVPKVPLRTDVGGGEQGGTTGGRSPMPTITTQAQFNALPSGAVYLEDGKQYRKP